jgi:hypothetical protein
MLFCVCVCVYIYIYIYIYTVCTQIQNNPNLTPSNQTHLPSFPLNKMYAEKKYFTVRSVHTTCHTTACVFTSECHCPHLHFSVSMFRVIASLVVAALTAAIPSSCTHFCHQTRPLCLIYSTFETLSQILLLGSLPYHDDPLAKETDAVLLGSWEPSPMN